MAQGVRKNTKPPFLKKGEKFFRSSELTEISLALETAGGYLVSCLTFLKSTNFKLDQVKSSSILGKPNRRGREVSDVSGLRQQGVPDWKKGPRDASREPGFIKEWHIERARI